MSDHEALLAIARLLVSQYYTSEAPTVWYQSDSCRHMVHDLEDYVETIKQLKEARHEVVD